MGGVKRGYKDKDKRKVKGQKLGKDVMFAMIEGCRDIYKRGL